MKILVMSNHLIHITEKMVASIKGLEICNLEIITE